MHSALGSDSLLSSHVGPSISLPNEPLLRVFVLDGLIGLLFYINQLGIVGLHCRAPGSLRERKRFTILLIPVLRTVTIHSYITRYSLVNVVFDILPPRE